MKSLRKRKAQSGESPESVRALHPSDMLKLWSLCKKNGKLGARQYVTLYSLYFIPQTHQYVQY